MKNTIRLFDHGIRPDSATDSTLEFRKALEGLDINSAKIVIEPGRYDFWPERATERYIYPSNNDAGLRRIAFPLLGLKDVEIDGQGAEFVFHGMIVPFVVQNSSNIVLRNFSVDWQRPFHTEAIVLDVVARDESNQRTVVDLKIPEQYPYVIRFNQLFFTDDTPHLYPVRNSLEFDPIKAEPAYLAWDNWHHKDYHYAEELEPGMIRFTSAFSKSPTAGNMLAITHTERDTPGIFIENSSDFSAYDITLYHAGAMGVIAQRTRNIRLERFNVTPPTHKGRIVSTTADATHLVNCAGHIELTDCHFQGQLDDATNVHGIYCPVSEIVSSTEIEIELRHEQQYGVQITQAGDQLEFVDHDTLLAYHKAGVVSVEILNKQFSRITLDSPLPERVKAGDAVASLGWVPDLTIWGCTATKNRARAFLISTRGTVLIENNRMHVPSPAIVIAGDVSGWFEAGAVADVTIRNNHFDNCNFGTEHCGVIEIMPEIREAHRGESCYHGNITVENNTFDVFDQHVVRGHCVDGFTFRNNVIRRSHDYPAGATVESPIDLTHSVNVSTDLDSANWLGAES